MRAFLALALLLSALLAGCTGGLGTSAADGFTLTVTTARPDGTAPSPAYLRLEPSYRSLQTAEQDLGSGTGTYDPPCLGSGGWDHAPDCTGWTRLPAYQPPRAPIMGETQPDGGTPAYSPYYPLDEGVVRFHLPEARAFLVSLSGRTDAAGSSETCAVAYHADGVHVVEGAARMDGVRLVVEGDATVRVAWSTRCDLHPHG